MKPGSADHQSSEAKDLVVFDILRESKCADCGKEFFNSHRGFRSRPGCLCEGDVSPKAQEALLHIAENAARQSEDHYLKVGSAAP